MSNHDNDGCGCLTALGAIVLVVVVLTACFGLGSMIMASDLPEWFKFWLIFG